MELKEGRLAVHLARKSAEAFLEGKKLSQEKEGGRKTEVELKKEGDKSRLQTIVDFQSKHAFNPGSLPEIFYGKRGVFVTLHTYPEKELRGCIGYPEPIFPLYKALADCAVHACQDPRFDPVCKSELKKIIFEVSVLTKPEILECSPSEYPKRVRIGKDGLIIRKESRSGLLLPQVATEYGFSPEAFLEHTCMKAGLNPQAWKEKDCRIFRFQAEIFSEKTPGGIVKR